MTRFIFSLLITLMTLTTYAQKDVTKFLGIPVDGTKTQMIQKLKAKGFKSSYYDRDILEGQFNGSDVNVHIVTNGNKVYRIMVADKTSRDETNIRIRFNRLCQQFENNSKYTTQPYGQSIPDDEDINYNISINNKRYEAVFYQKPDTIDEGAIINTVNKQLLSKYSQEQITNPTEEIITESRNMVFEYMYDIISKKTVWFMISENGYNKYTICMYYDNLYNQANGEDL